MKSNELMIGDWYYWEAEGKMYPYQVTAEDFIKGDIPNFQPIPLTEEILEKNGFLVDSNEIFYLKENLKFGLKKDIDYGYWFINRADNYKECICACDFVHELQHALKLCGIEKEIIL